MRQQWFTHVRLLVAHLTRSRRAFFPERSPPRLLTDAASGGLGSPPVRRARRAKPSSLAQHRLCWRPSTSPSRSFHGHTSWENGVFGSHRPAAQRAMGRRRAVTAQVGTDLSGVPLCAGKRDDDVRLLPCHTVCSISTLSSFEGSASSCSSTMTVVSCESPV